MADAEMHVDFTNRHLHIARVILSATQDEVLFSVCPDLFLAMLMCGEHVAGDEAIIVGGARKNSCYDGFLDTIRFAGPAIVGRSDDNGDDSGDGGGNGGGESGGVNADGKSGEGAGR
ncbi:unnamed protein product [Phaeothamnion confervicola]